MRLKNWWKISSRLVKSSKSWMTYLNKLSKSTDTRTFLDVSDQLFITAFLYVLRFEPRKTSVSQFSTHLQRRKKQFMNQSENWFQIGLDQPGTLVVRGL